MILQGRIALRLKVLHADAGIRQGEERLPPLVDSPSREEPRNVPALKAVEVVVCQDLQCNVQTQWQPARTTRTRTMSETSTCESGS